jgi:hypothetical protein
MERCNQRPGTDTWRLGIARCATQHATDFQAFCKSVNNDPGKLEPPNCKTENRPRHNQDFTSARRQPAPPSVRRALVAMSDAQEVMLSLLAQRRGNVRRHCCAAVEGVLRQSRETPGQQLTSRRQGNSLSLSAVSQAQQTTSGPPAAGIMT